MSTSRSSAMEKWGWATLAQYSVLSWLVPALRMPPTPSMAAEMSCAWGKRAVPLKHMCSTK